MRERSSFILKVAARIKWKTKMRSPLVISYENETYYPQALQLAARLGLEVSNDGEYRLHCSENGLFLCVPGFSPIQPCFTSKALLARVQAGKKQGLVRACQPHVGQTILDLTAGWGQESTILASLGAKVTMLERHPYLAILLEDALRRADKSWSLTLIQAEAADYLQQLSGEDYPEVIYMDPMHPARKKSALVKKPMQILQGFIPPNDDVETLIRLARSRVKQRVVVKWPSSEAPIIPYDYTIEEKTVRFDVYRGLCF
ncbi:MAG: class I SAM-dependent methyltransferase [Legionellaceae bacterium]|nr:class I SAM-dependent methyltransferase [Legionellaceae bacterium]